MPNSAVLTAIALAALSASAAQADMKVTQTTKIDNPQLTAYQETLTPQQRAQMAHSGGLLSSLGPKTTTIYFSGGKTRADIGPISYVYNAATRSTTVINRKNHTYATRPYKAPPAGQFQATVKSTGQSKSIQGHPARRYLLSATTASLPGTVIQGDIWAAQDLPTPPALTGGGPFAVADTLLRKVKGYPLLANIAVTGSPMGNTTFKSTVTSVSQTPLPASVFAIPTGYKKTALTEGGGM